MIIAILALRYGFHSTKAGAYPNVAYDPTQRHYVQTLYHLTKSLDPTRPVIGNDGWEHVISDIYSIHDYSFEGTILRERYGSTEAVERTLHEVQPHYRTLDTSWLSAHS